MKTKPYILAVLLITLVGCTVRGGFPRFLRKGEASDGAIKREMAARQSAVDYLKEQLNRRPAEIVDLEAVGKTMVKKWGAPAAEYAVYNSWSGALLNDGNTQAWGKECDVLWLQTQPDRVRDIAWLVCFKSQWLPK